MGTGQGSRIAAAVLQYDFMQNAFAASAAAALVAGPVGWFLVLRGQGFAAHALSHVGFTGAAAALLAGLPPLAGLVGLTVAAGLLMGSLGEGVAGSGYGDAAGGRDVAVGAVLAALLGVGLLCLHFLTAGAGQAVALLFGNPLAVEAELAWALAGLSSLCLLAMAVMARPLLLASLQPELAAAQGVRPRLVGTLFLGVAALAVAACAQVVGALLVFALMIGPPAAVQRLCGRVGPGMALAAALALAWAWLGLALSYWTDWPASAWITGLSTSGWLAALAWARWRPAGHPSRA